MSYTRCSSPALLFACERIHAAEPQLPIIFVHGNGDTAGLWITTIWRFETNGYPHELLHAVDLRYPLARSVDDKVQAGRSSASDVMVQLAEEVERVGKRTGAHKVFPIAELRAHEPSRTRFRVERRQCRALTSWRRPGLAL